MLFVISSSVPNETVENNYMYFAAVSTPCTNSRKCFKMSSFAKANDISMVTEWVRG